MRWKDPVGRVVWGLVVVGMVWLLSGSGGPMVEAESSLEGAPNILVMMSDDMGWSDLGCFGGEIETPNLDQLATDGLRFTDFYNTARCCPTRASLLTGLYPHQAGIGHMMEDRGHDGYRGDLNRRAVTMAEVLRPAGYATYAVGKWHVTPAATEEQLTHRHNWPRARGFDRYYGTLHGAGSFYDPSALVRDDQLISVANDPAYRPEKYYYTDALSDHAVRFLSEHQLREKARRPWFLYLAYTAPHWPMHALEEDLTRYEGRYDLGYDAVRQKRFAASRRLGLIDPRWGLSPTVGLWSEVSDRAWEARGMEVYAAMIDRMDQGIGRIVAELKRQGELEKTLILYLQDNGGCAEPQGRAPSARNPYRERPAAPVYPPMGKDELQYGSVPRQTRDGRAVLMGPGALPGPEDTYIAYGAGWANVSNTPFREYKHWVHEGGIATPLIVHWPAGIGRRQRGGLVSAPTHLIDVMATVTDVSGAAYPKQFGGIPIQPMEGISLRPALTGKALRRSAPLFWEHEGNRAIRDGRWKLVAKADQPWELYDLTVDRTEQQNLAAAQPRRVRALAAQWEAWAARAQVLPLGQWKARPRAPAP
jgi:arylsulfatase A-like enzyme